MLLTQQSKLIVKCSIRFVEQMAGPLARNRICIANYSGRWPGLGKLMGLWPATRDFACGV